MRTDSTAEAARFRVHGRVQGVGYRFFVLRAAQELGLHGWVRNRRDGTVELLAWGRRSQLLQLEQRLRIGPPQARVEDVEREPAAAEAGHSGFSIRHELE